MHWDHYWPSKWASVLGTRLGIFRFFQAGKKSQSSYFHRDDICGLDNTCGWILRRTAHQGRFSNSRHTRRNGRTTMALMAFCTGPGIHCAGWAIVVFCFGSFCVEPRTAITFIVRLKLKAEEIGPPCPRGEQPNPSVPFVTGLVWVSQAPVGTVNCLKHCRYAGPLPSVRSTTSLDITSRAVSPTSRFFPASRTPCSSGNRGSG